MVNIAANMTQVLTNSPQVTALVAGEAGAMEQIKRQEQIEQSRQLREQQRNQVLAAEKALRPGESEEEIRRRLESRDGIKITEREARQRRRTMVTANDRNCEPQASAATSASLFEIQTVIDRCV